MGPSPTTEYHDEHFNRYLRERIRLLNERAEKEKAEIEVREEAKRTNTLFYFFYRATSDLTRFITILTFLNNQLTSLLCNVMPWTAIIATIFASLLKIIIAVLISNESMPTRISKGVGATACLTLGIAAIVLAGSYITFAAMSIDIAHNIWQIGELAFNRYNKAWKQRHAEIALAKNQMQQTYENYLQLSTRSPVTFDSRLQLDEMQASIFATHKKIVAQENTERLLNYKLAKKTHSTLMSAFVATGIVLSMIPMTAPVGAAILIGMAIYCVLDTFQVNPFKYVAKKMFGDPFTEIIPAASFQELQPTLNKTITPANKTTAFKNIPSSTKIILSSVGTAVEKMPAVGYTNTAVTQTESQADNLDASYVSSPSYTTHLLI